MDQEVRIDYRFRFKHLLVLAEYVGLLITFVYWFIYSLFRSRGVPIIFDGLALDTLCHGLLVVSILGFSSLFFSHLFIELISGCSTARVRFVSLLCRRRFGVYICLVVLALVTGGRFDYASYKLQWSLIVAGGDPWGLVTGGMVNAYGYLFNAFAIPFALSSILPKTLFVVLLILFAEEMQKQASTSCKELVFFLCINPFTVSSIAVYGFIDGVCSVLLGLALISLYRGTQLSAVSSGVLLSLSFLTKFYSVVAFPIFVSSLVKSNRSLLRPLVLGFSITSIGLVCLSYALWGDSILSPLQFAQGRDPSFLTFWNYIDARQLRSPIFCISSFIAISCACLRARLSSSLRVTAVLSIIFGTYYLGHQQFYLAIIVPMSVYISEVFASQEIRMRMSSSLVFAAIIGWLIFIQTTFELFDEFKPLGLSSLIPVFAWANSAILLSAGIYWMSSKLTKTVHL